MILFLRNINVNPRG